MLYAKPTSSQIDLEVNTEKAHSLPASERCHARTFAWAQSLGLIPTNIPESQKDKLMPNNLIRISKTVCASLGDSVSSSRDSKQRTGNDHHANQCMLAPGD